VIGFSLVFVVFGTLAGLLGATIGPYRIWLTRIAGIFVILFGLMMLNVFKFSLFKTETGLKTLGLERGKPRNSLILGAAFAFGWTPCVGPILGSVLLLTTSAASALNGAILLSIFSLGLAMPFLLIAAGVEKARERIAKFAKYLNIVSMIGGVLLVLLGILLFTDNMAFLIQWGYQFLDFLDYERIQDYL
jgi:cytochrome c-type biogenesis protein